MRLPLHNICSYSFKVNFPVYCDTLYPKITLTYFPYKKHQEVETRPGYMIYCLLISNSKENLFIYYPKRASLY